MAADEARHRIGQNGTGHQATGQKRREARRALQIQGHEQAHVDRSRIAQHHEPLARREPTVAQGPQIQQGRGNAELPHDEQGQHDRLGPHEDQRRTHCARHLVQPVDERAEPGEGETGTDAINGTPLPREQAPQERENADEQNDGHGRGDEKQRPQPSVGEQQARQRRSESQTHADDAAIDGEHRGLPPRWGDGQDHARDHGEEQSHGQRLHEARREHGLEVPGEKTQQRSDKGRPIAERHDPAHAEALEQRHRHDNDRGRHHGKAEHEPVGHRQTHVEVGGQLVEGNVHERLAKRCQQIARQHESPEEPPAAARERGRAGTCRQGSIASDHGSTAVVVSASIAASFCEKQGN